MADIYDEINDLEFEVVTMTDENGDAVEFSLRIISTPCAVQPKGSLTATPMVLSPKSKPKIRNSAPLSFPDDYSLRSK